MEEIIRKTIREFPDSFVGYSLTVRQKNTVDEQQAEFTKALDDKI